MAAARSHSGVFMLAENSSFWPEVTRAKQLLDAGAIGELVTARSHYYEALNASPFADEGEVRVAPASAIRNNTTELCGMPASYHLTFIR
jgi:predicted dehydrogenase